MPERSSSPLAQAAGALADLVLPRVCAGCARAHHAVCPACSSALAGPVLRTDPPHLAAALAAAGGMAGPPACYAAARYEGPVREVLLAFKEHGRLDAARPLAAALAQAVIAATATGTGTGTGTAQLGSTRPLLLVPVPSARSAVRRRGFDHAARLARGAASEIRRRDGRAAEVAPVLRLVRPVADQSGMGVWERAVNISGAFGVRGVPRALENRRQAHLPAPPHRPGRTPCVIVVDDIATTGASLAEAVRALRGCGVDVAGAAVVAATPSRSRAC